MTLIIQWLQQRYRRVVGSIAFLPAVIALLFLAVAFAMVWFDFSASGKSIKSNLHWLSLKDASTARSIISAIVTGIISLAVFSFSLVMIILNQTAANMSNRILDKLIGNRFQQVVLGFYIGSIIYALFLLSTIRDINEGVYVPALSVYLLIALTIIDIFLFIYFLHYVTQSVKYATIIGRIARQTQASLDATCSRQEPELPVAITTGRVLSAPASGLIQKIHYHELAALLTEQDSCAALLYPPGAFVLEGTPYLCLSGEKEILTKAEEEKIHHRIVIGKEQQVADNHHYGFRQLMEVAVKALSPGINDPGTAEQCVQALAILLRQRTRQHPQCNFYDKQGILRLVVPHPDFERLLADCLTPIWHYGHEDPIIQRSFREVLVQLSAQSQSATLQYLLAAAKKEQHHYSPI